MKRFVPFENQVIDGYTRATIEYLYSECLHGDDPDWGMVSVDIRRWRCGTSHNDVILQRYLIVDGEAVESGREILPRHWTTADYQRHGIKVFDELLARHPELSHQDDTGPVTC